MAEHDRAELGLGELSRGALDPGALNRGVLDQVEPDRVEPDPGRLGTGRLDPEDAKIVTLARSARARTGAAEGAAVRDTDGRTYAGCTVELPSLRLSALQVAVAMAASAGAPGLEAAAVVTGSGTVDSAGLAAARDLTAAVPVLLTGPDGNLTRRA